MRGQTAKRLRRELFNVPFQSGLLGYKVGNRGETRNHPGAYRALYLAFKKEYINILRSGDPHPFETFINRRDKILAELN